MEPDTDNSHSPKSRPINSTWLRRTATLCAIALLKRIRKRFSDVLFLTSGVCTKYGDNVGLAGAATLEYVGTHTLIPVPKVYYAFEHKGKT